jgi:hypothetical protein
MDLERGAIDFNWKFLESMGDIVECYSGIEYAERPVAIWWQQERLEIIDVLERQRTPDGKYFRVTVQGGVFELFYNETIDEWRINQL